MLKSLPLCILWKKVYLGWAEYNVAQTIPSNLPYKYQRVD